jgi:hypothetical protein
VTARQIARYAGVTLMGLAVLVATADGFAQSYSGLLRWATEHGLRGWKADSFPLLVDLFVGVGEMGLFLLAIDAHRLRRAFMSWLDLLVPLCVAASGWTASLIFNVGGTRHIFSYQATAAIPPIASMVGLLVLLRTLHRYVVQADEKEKGLREVYIPGAELHPPAGPIEGPSIDDEDAELMAWLRGDLVSKAEVRVPAVPPEPSPDQVRAASEFADEVHRGKVPSIRAIKKRLRIGQPSAQNVKAYLERLAANRPELEEAR